MKVETVKIVAPVTAENPLGFIVVNKSDLSPSMIVYREPAAKPAPKPAKTADKD